MKKNDLEFYWKLFSSMFLISMSTFGGGFVIITLMQKKYCDDLHWINRDEILNLTAIAQTAPGSLAVNASILLGYQLKGIKGALVAALATIIPPLLIISIIAMFYNAFIENRIVKIALQVMRSGVAAVIFDAVISLMKDVLKTKDILNITVMIIAFVASYFINVDTIVIISVCLALAIAIELISQKQSEKTI